MPENATMLPELRLAASVGARYVAGIDEVGRGALAGPVTVGVAVLDLLDPQLQICRDTGVAGGLDGVRDSKLLTPAARLRWAPVVHERAAAVSIQHREASRIDAVGINAALREAGLAGLQKVESLLGTGVDAVIIDGSHDWLTAGRSPRVHPMVRADVKAVCVASASVIAKVDRDVLMERLADRHPAYGWESNRGYGSAAHRQALRESGVTRHHRQTWNLGPVAAAAASASARSEPACPPQGALFG